VVTLGTHNIILTFVNAFVALCTEYMLVETVASKMTRQAMYTQCNVTLRHFRVTTVAVDKQQVLHILSTRL